MFRTRRALVTLLAACLLGGCSDDDPEPNIDSDPTPSSPTVSESVTPSPTVTPADPGQTVSDWVAARNSALQDGDTAAVEALGSEDCTTCEDSLEPIREVYANGGHFETTGWKLLASEIESQSATLAKVNAGIEYAAGRTFPDAESEPVSYEAEKHIVVFRLVMVDSSWRIKFIGYLS